jgi:uncharacterized OB-fold protein
VTEGIAPQPLRPLPNPLTQFFWDGAMERRLLILQCQNCGHHIHYPRPVCNRCRSTDLAPHEVAGKGSIYAYTVTMQAFHPYYVDKIPYVVAVVELDAEPGLRLTTNIVECEEEDLHTGLRVEVVWTEVASDLVLPMFRPVAA